mmetsp:Transcript_47719/g.97095  ORF Transcript_47719/g.97095 Transcript_47719/m.97095 type:complete len:244 (+) Transcript_47719:361-1092(+)
MMVAATDAVHNAVRRSTSSSASGSNSKNATYSMAPAAKPRPTGRNGKKAWTDMKAGTAIKGCGRDEITAHIDASRRPTPRGTRTRQMARPSGTLWMASVVEMNMPNCEPEAPAKDTPMPTPSARECSVITAMMRSILLAEAPDIPLNWRSSCCSSTCLVPMMNAAPPTAPAAARTQAADQPAMWYSSCTCTASNSRPTLAAAIMPHASALHAPSQNLRMSPTMAKGSTPRPVDTAVIQPAPHT